LFRFVGKINSEWVPVASEIKRDEAFYNQGFLGKSNDEYRKLMMMDGTWGGGIELSILSDHYRTEFVVVNENGVINKFGEDKQYEKRGFLFFYGSHYEPLFLKRDTVITTLIE
jgi:ubiquitin thioesterase OTU1